jgi:hypothetical protein
MALCAVVHPAAAAKDAGPVNGAEQHVADEDPKATLVALKNAIRKSLQDPSIHLRIAKIYFQLVADPASALDIANLAGRGELWRLPGSGDGANPAARC